MGRPTKLTTAIQEKVVQAILAGNYFETACAYAGVARVTGYEWMARGEEKNPRGRKSSALYAMFASAVREAEAKAEVGTVANIKKGLPDDPRLALEFLSRRYPDRWSAKNRHEVTGKDGAPVEVAHEHNHRIPIDQFRQLPLEERLRVLRESIRTAGSN